MTINLADYQLSALPEAMYYIPSFISSVEESQILASLPQNRWINLSHRRLQAWPSVLSKSNTLLAAPLPGWLERPCVGRLQRLGIFGSDDGRESDKGRPNHCLINEYRPDEGIMPHEDGAAYRHIVATISLGGSSVLDVYEKGSRRKEDAHDQGNGGQTEDDGARSKPRWRILQEPRSLLVTVGKAYTETLHGIAEFEVDEDLGPETVANWNLLEDETRKEVMRNGGRSARVTRTSLTFREVLKVSKIGARILGKPRV